MNTVKAFVKKYWLTVCIFVGLFVVYYISTETERANPFLFPKVALIGDIFVEHRETMFLNLLSSIKLMVPSIFFSVLIALTAGTVLGMNEKLREALHPVIYTFSVIPSILLAPFVLLLSPSFYFASVFLIVYSTTWGTLFATITGIMTIDKRYLDN